ncbi:MULTISPECIES: urease accessory protein UreE [Alphaproteobacteria]|uniref:Urease accessory protein UreE n=2 Tax=Alphaproteobacteria TaxID=28211 RepID=A0A512HJL0_9HYPH|nr:MULTISPECIES: urease accessory protein UreE [Alphaproteobacteria]GEO85590.1 urease accessory protein UreE [Ciceribacter naphthalenivorans]GLR22055.1 urease accessory protein UreE [Ciceribacter naphthalenivorans]GLT04911.1 urease accessory protein UreE [Sphingomonas psychrolutea]
MRRALSHLPAGTSEETLSGYVTLSHDERHLRRKLLHLEDGDMVMLDLRQPVQLAHGDLLLLDDGTAIEVRAVEEKLFEIRPRDQRHLVELAWHLGNRHLPAQIEAERILILRDHVIRDMLIGLGATVVEVTERFQPMRGAYHSHGGGHGHHDHDHA